MLGWATAWNDAERSGWVSFCLGYAMSSSTALRSASVASTKRRPSKRRAHSRSSQASPPRIWTLLRSRWDGSASGSSITKSMNSGTRASVALPERASRGITMSASSRTVAHSWAEKNFGT